LGGKPRVEAALTALPQPRDEVCTSRSEAHWLRSLSTFRVFGLKKNLKSISPLSFLMKLHGAIL